MTEALKPRCEGCGRRGRTVVIYDCGEHSHLVHGGIADCYLALDPHDSDCELRPGGKYEGRVLADGKGIPCHCVARADGRAKAGRELLYR